MKKFLTLALLLGSIAFVAPSAEAKSAESTSSIAINAAPQDGWRNNRRWNRVRVRTETRTRTIRIGRQRYRETIQIRYLPNGRTQTRILSRVR
jgi:hypothetical protein